MRGEVDQLALEDDEDDSNALTSHRLDPIDLANTPGRLLKAPETVGSGVGTCGDSIYLDASKCVATRDNSANVPPAATPQQKCCLGGEDGDSAYSSGGVGDNSGMVGAGNSSANSDVADRDEMARSFGSGV